MPDTLPEALADYHRGLRAEMALLRQIEALSGAQRDASVSGDLARLARISSERDRLTQALVTLEAQVRPVRDALSDHLPQARLLPGFEELVALHRHAERLVSVILADDHATHAALQDAERARRLAAQTIEVGEATLAAYRRVLSPAPGSAGLIDRRG